MDKVFRTTRAARTVGRRWRLPYISQEGITKESESAAARSFILVRKKKKKNKGEISFKNLSEGAERKALLFPVGLNDDFSRI